jgi:Reverse transcriptase (RNA-dependent DNA polymerase)
VKDSIRQHRTPVFCKFLDALKAFDRLYYCKLSKLLLKHELPVTILRVLINTYTNNTNNSIVRVIWGGATSDYLSIVNGVKHGAVLSPVLFCVYIDDILTGFGCYIGPVFVGALSVC